MTGYTKLFAEIIESTIWQETNDCRVLWITLLALKDREHVCRATIPYLAKVANITVEQVEEYLARFQEPDKYSRSQEHEGRRIERVDGGWFILNGEKYRQKLSQIDRKEQVRAAVARHRKKKESLHPSDPQSANGRRLKLDNKGGMRSTLGHPEENL